MKKRILSSSEKRKILKKELQKAKKRVKEATDNITMSQENLNKLNKEFSELDNKLLHLDIKMEDISVIIAYVSSTGTISLFVSTLLSLILKFDFVSTLFISALLFFGGVSVGFILIADKALEKKEVNLFNRLSIKISNYLKSTKKYKNLNNEYQKVYNDIQILESSISKERKVLTNLILGIRTLESRLYSSSNCSYTSGKSASIVRNERPLSSKKKKQLEKK